MAEIKTVIPVRVTRYRAPTSGRTFSSRSAAYRGEAKARLASLCDCNDGYGPCRYHEPARWVRDFWCANSGQTYSINGLIVARLAALLAREDGYSLPWPAARKVPEPPDEGEVPF